MTHEEKLSWMAMWAVKNNCQLTLRGDCGIMRECVGIMVSDNYPDYEWYDEKYNRVDGNGTVWRPEDAYHKHPCVAVLGRGEKAESQLYDWLKWFEDNGFVIEAGIRQLDKDERKMAALMFAMGRHQYCRMVRKP